MPLSVRGARERTDGICVCPQCGYEADDMHVWVTHVSDEHNPFMEFVSRWKSYTPE